MKTNGKQIWLLAFIVLVMSSLAACAKPASNVSSQSAGPAPAQQPANSETPKEAWEREWEKTVELAKKEGEVTIIGPAATSREELMRQFEKQYPGIKVKYIGMRPSLAVSKLLAEQQQDKYLSDILLEGGQQIAFDLFPAGATDDIRKFIVFPEIQDDNNWYMGYEAGYSMASNTGQYVFAIIALPNIHINHDVIPEGEIKTLQDLLDPRWRGKMVLHNFARQAQGHGTLAALAASEGKEFVLKLLEQEPLVIDDPRQLIEAYVTGKYPIGIGLDNTMLRQFREQGVVKNSGKLQPEVSTVVTPFPIGVLKNQPHPNAAKVFINWFLSKEGQNQFVTLTKESQSRRKDVAESVYEDVRGWDKVDYRTSNLEKEGLEAAKWVTELSKTYFQNRPVK
ncbi:ABC transporter substrate-binding protein [Brevibacillus reuszeri]|uniref:ABC transporter substrate-binding protein n=1 Tax=Brevibacillus reuszeri TaxID=54915 RepID=UPI000CCC7CF8|nr:extracellular solute-binding protein [Brevibacillus reuszeri]